jgi:transcriptional regulator with XRE-family HTH domain
MNEKLRLARLQRGLSELDVCSAVGCDLKSYVGWELGKHIPQSYFRQRLVEFFKLSLDELGYDPVTLLARSFPERSAGQQVADSAPGGIQALTKNEQVLSIYVLTQEEAASFYPLMRGKSVNMNQLRRKLLQLGIAGATLVVAPPMDALLASSDDPTDPAEDRANDEHMALLENEMASRWMLYYTGGAARASLGFDRWLQEATKNAQLARGTLLYERAHLVLCMSYQLQGCILRDMMHFPEAHRAFRRAFLVAQELHSPEMMGASLAREGVTLTQQDLPGEAVTYLNQALEAVKHLGFITLEGYILQGLSEAQAKEQLDTSWGSLEQAEARLGQKSRVVESSFTRFNAASVTAQRGVNAALLHDYAGCVSLIDQSLKIYDATLVRGRARLIMQKAEAYWKLGEVDTCALQAQEAYLLASSAGASKTVDRARNLHALLLQSPYGKEREVIALSELISTQSVQ